MKIYSINPTNQFAKQTKTNFKGLWGEEEAKQISTSYSDHAQMCDMGTDHVIITKSYYPFLDETGEEIRNVIENNTGKSTNLAADRDLTPSSPYAWVDCTDYIRETVVKIMPRLEISASEFAAYKARELLSKAEMAVEDALKVAKLQKYLRK